MFELGKEQEKALAKMHSWLEGREPGIEQVFKLFGLAGTGKSTLASIFRGQLDGRVLEAAYTGKAANVMREKGSPDASTVHSLIYRLADDRDIFNPRFILNNQSRLKGAELLILDECSMISEECARDLLSFGTPILVLGDPGQLPPIEGDSFFSSDPHILLEEIHRQARENPIINMALRARKGERLPFGRLGKGKFEKIPRNDLTSERLLRADQVICGTNKTRRNLNKQMRKEIFQNPSWMPQEGDKVICLKNYHEEGLFNGMILYVEEEGKDLEFGKEYILKEEGESDRRWRVPMHQSFFQVYNDPNAFKNVPRKAWKEYMQFDFGYSVTGHKAQGSQWKDLLVVDESYCFREESARWLYTAITRASETLTIVG